jgi:aspartyl-tRNA(Asn)/glutamyl-tRNA(Gln) amidotransferase subunit A
VRADLPDTVIEAATRLRQREVTSVDLVGAALARADSLGPALGTYVSRFDEQALDAAYRADQELERGIDRGVFHGIPVGVKDILAAAEGRTTANSLVLDPAWGDGRDAPVVTRLRAAGAVITGKTTTSEYACGSPDPTKPFAIPRNPWDLERSPAGSSAGTGNGVAAGLFLAGLGTDTGGSIRAPAHANGITGLKPTFGRVPKSGCVPLGYSLDHIGPLARTARDCAAMLGIIAGYDPSDESCADVAVGPYLEALDGALEGVRVGVERTHHFPDDADSQLAEQFERAIAVLADLGATTVAVDLPYYDEMRAGLLATMLPEALAYHLHDLRNRWADYYASTRLTLAFGALVAPSDYVQAQRLRRVVQQRMAELYADVDVVVSPGAPRGADRLDDAPRSVVTRLLRSSFTSYWNMTGQPAVTLPMGFSEDGLPLSLQIAGRPFEEAAVLRVGDAFQSVTNWHLTMPPLVQAAVS